MNQPDYNAVLERILDNVSNIELLLKTTTEESFMTNLKDFNAICLEFIQIGEKVNQLPEEFYERSRVREGKEGYYLGNDYPRSSRYQTAA